MEVSVAETILRVKDEQFNRGMDAAEKRVMGFGRLQPSDAFGKFLGGMARDVQVVSNRVVDSMKQGVSGTNLLGDAFKQLGVRSQAELNSMAQRALDSFNIIKRSGTAAPQDIQHAWTAAQGFVRAAADNMQTGATTAFGRIREAVNGLMGNIKQMGVQMLIAGAALSAAVTAPIVHVIQLGLEFNAFRERAQVAFTALLGDTGRADVMLRELFQFAAVTPFEFQGLTAAAQQLLAVGVNAEAVIPSLAALGDAVSAFGGTTEVIDRVTVQLVQMIGRGRATMEDLRPIVSAIPKAFNVMARELGISLDEMRDRMEKGALDAASATKALLIGLTNDFAGSMEKQSKTFTGLMSTLRDTIKIGFGELTKDLFERIKGGLALLVDILPKVVVGFIALPPAIKNTALAILGIVAVVGPVLVALGGLIAFLGGPMTLALIGIVGTVTLMTAAFAVNTAHIAKMTESWIGAGMRPSYARLAAMIGALADSFSILSRIIIQAYDFIISHTIAFAQAIIGVFKALKNSIGDILVGAVTGDILQMAEGFKNMKDTITVEIGKAGQTVRDSALRMVDSAKFVEAHMKGQFAQQFALAFLNAGKATSGFTLSLQDRVKEITAAFEKMQKGMEENAKKGRKATQVAFEGLNDDTKQIIQSWLQEQQKGIQLSKELWNSLPAAVQQPLIRMAEVFKLAQATIQRAELELIAEQSAGLATKRRIIETTMEIYDKLGLKVRETFARMGVDIRVALPGIISEQDKLKTRAEQILGAALPLHAERTTQAITAMASTSQAELQKMGGELTKLAETWQKETERIEADNKRMAEGLRRQFDDLSRSLPQSWNIIIDAIVNKSGKLGEAVFELANRIKGWASDILETIALIPGGFGDTVRKVLATIDQWILFADKIIGILHKLKITSIQSISDLITKLGGIFKGGFQNILGAAAGFAGALGGILGARGQGAGAGAISGAVGGFAGLVGVASLLKGVTLGGLLGGPIGIGVIAGGALLGALLGRKSAAQKEQERLGLEQQRQQVESTKQQLQKGAQEVMQAALQTMRDAMQTLEQLADFTRVPKETIRAFFKNLEQVITLFAELAGQFSGAMLAKAKEFAESIGPVVAVINDGAIAFQQLSRFTGAARPTIESFGKALGDTIEVLAGVFDSFEKRTIKLVRKLAEKTLEVVNLVGEGVAAFTGLADFKDVPEQAVEALGATIERVVVKMMEVSERIDKFLLKQAAIASERMAAVVALIGGAVESFKGLMDFQPVASSVMDALFESIRYAVTKMQDIVSTMSTEMLDRAEIVAQKSLAVFEAIKLAVEAFTMLREYQAIPQMVLDTILQDFQRAVHILSLLIEQIMHAESMAMDFKRRAEAMALNITAGLTAFTGAIADLRDSLVAYRGTVQTGRELFNPSLVVAPQAQTTQSVVVQQGDTMHITLTGDTAERLRRILGEFIDPILGPSGVPRLAMQGIR